MKNRYTFLMRKFWLIGILIGCTTVMLSCDDDKDYTTGMPSNQLINSITLEVSSELPVAIGMDTTLVCVIDPVDPTDAALLWTSLDETVATVSQDGTITGKALGTTVITVTPAIGFGVKDITEQTIRVNVVSEIIKATAIEFTNVDGEGDPLKELYQTDNIQLTYQILPENHTYSYLTWKSSDEKIATVDKNGVVTGITPGNVTITAYTNDKSGVVGKYDLTILAYIPVEEVTILPYTDKLYMHEEVLLDFTYTPASATAGSVKWVSSNDAVVTVEQGKVKAVGFGTAVVTATCDLNNNSASATITVDPGWWIWDWSNQFRDWVTPTGGAKMERKDGKLVVTLNTGDKRRADVSIPASNNNPVYMDLGNYPVLAMRCTVPKGGNNTLDLVSVDGTGGGGPRCNDGITLGDGTRLIYYDVPVSGKDLPTTGLVGFRTFCIKVADIPSANVTSDTYDIYWIRTFKSIAEMEAFAKAEVAAGN